MNKIAAIIILAFFAAACGGNAKKQQETATQKATLQTEALPDNSDWEEIHASIAEIESFDGTRILESGQGFFVGNNLLVTQYSLVSQATNVKVKPFNENKTYTADKFVAFDRINDLIILQVDGIDRNPIQLFEGSLPNFTKSMYVAPKTGKTIQLFSGKVLNLANVKGSRLYRLSNVIRKSQFGTPIFTADKKAIGVAYSATVDYEMQSFAIPSVYISDMLKKQKEKPESLAALSVNANAETAAENAKIKGIVLETDAGNITLQLFNETPEYRDNFIRLAKEQYFDSLLIHRVIANFGIQSGAADTRYAEPGDNVGWKGPGYTIPAHIIPGLYHKRGMVGSPRKPDTANQRRRSDGSQFYIVSGRKYFDNELDEIEKQNDYKFSAEQRQVYKTIGGAPHLDGSYTIFGKVISGMDVVDKIAKVETDQRWRPVKDIRIKRVRILK
ncbi:peptidylprolyl isomerase [Maribellus sp. YY47]|uniref:peptidylprolyl isomerase n=1 Tax=Maribellus sp. YY47 TaxID=2929486 RepID=UPI00200182CC|nr:peptidylprolyl isomerase [Maribellus sp. YY47]MCK3683567.1 peptidylprolyl isomerase [Maribellus sp. YY47]